MPRAGNYYIMSGTWIVDNLRERVGVVKEIGNQHKSGTVVIQWRYNSTSWVSAPMFRSYLMDGRYSIDHEQHPYDKADEHWGVNP